MDHGERDDTYFRVGALSCSWRSATCERLESYIRKYGERDGRIIFRAGPLEDFDRACLPRVTNELADQTRLAHPGIAGNQDQAAAALLGLRKVRAEFLKFLLPTDEDRR